MGLTVIMILVGVGLVAFAHFRNPDAGALIAAIGGAFICLGLSTIFPRFDTASSEAFGTWWRAVMVWAGSAFDSPDSTRLSIGLVLGVVVGGILFWWGRKKGNFILALLAFVVLLIITSVVFPHFMKSTFEFIQMWGKISWTWLTTAFSGSTLTR